MNEFLNKTAVQLELYRRCLPSSDISKIEISYTIKEILDMLLYVEDILGRLKFHEPEIFKK